MLEGTILSNLLLNEEYARKVLPFLKASYFADHRDRIAFTAINEYVTKYNTVPTKDILCIDINGRSNINEAECRTTIEYVQALSTEKEKDAWLIDNTEKFCQDKAIYNAIMASIAILEDKTGKKTRNAIPDLLTTALGVSFDTHIGHDYIEDFGKRFEFYHRVLNRVPFGLEMLDKITNGGPPRKSLNVLAGGTGFGKTMFLTNFAANFMTAGRNVLYITLEMSEEEIAKRIDANLCDISLSMVDKIPQDTFEIKMKRIRENTVGKLIIKEYPGGSAHAGNFRALLHELKIKKNFIPDVVVVDYLNLCASARVKLGNNINTYTYVKYIAEELRGLAQENNFVMFSATQVNREGFKSSDPGLENTSESFGLPATVDFMAVIIPSDELHAMGQVMFKQLKNRYTDFLKDNRFVMGVDRDKQRLYDVEQTGQAGVMPDIPVFDHGQEGTRERQSMKDLFAKFR